VAASVRKNVKGSGLFSAGGFHSGSGPLLISVHSLGGQIIFKAGGQRAVRGRGFRGRGRRELLGAGRDRRHKQQSHPEGAHGKKKPARDTRRFFRSQTSDFRSS
jgi:hypothetical protein